MDWKSGKHFAQWLNTLSSYAYPKIGQLLVSDRSFKRPAQNRCKSRLAWDMKPLSKTVRYDER